MPPDSNQEFVLSVITPVLNGHTHIRSCLDNVRDQGVARNEHLIVDGGSTDGTLEIIRQRAAEDPSVRLIEGPDRGQSHAMNKGIQAAKAPLLGILNVDDHYLSGTLALAIARLMPSPEPSFLWGACEVRDHSNGKVWVQPPGRLETWRMVLGWDFEPHPANPAAYFYHRSLHAKAGWYDESEHFAMDADFLLRAAPHVRKLIKVPEVLGVFELAPGTKTFEDRRRGENRERLARIFEKAERGMPMIDRLRTRGARLQRRIRWAFERRILRRGK